MTPEIVLVFAILVAAVILFVTEIARVDVVALMVLVSLTLTGLLSPEQVVSGFSNPAVITVWAVFILSGGLSRTGVAAILGRQVLRLAGNSETRLIVVIMLTAAVLSAFMNNVGVEVRARGSESCLSTEKRPLSAVTRRRRGLAGVC